MNVLPAGLAAILGIAYGIYLSFRLKRRERLLVKLMLMTEEMLIRIRFRTPDIYELLKTCSESGGFGELSFIGSVLERTSESGDFHSEWRSSVNSFQGINAEDKQILLSLGENLGTSDLTGQTEMLETHIELIKRQAEAARQEYFSKGKMLRSIGALCGIGLGIVIL